MVLQKISDHILYKDKYFHCAFPAIVKTSEYLLLVFRRAKDVRYLLGLKQSQAFDEKEQAYIDKLKTIVDHIDSRSHLVAMTLNSSLQPLTTPAMLDCDPFAADQDASLLTLSNGNILLSSFSWYPLPSYMAPILYKHGVEMIGGSDARQDHYIMWGGFTRLSQNNGQTWGTRQYLPHLPMAPEIIPGIRHACGGPIRGQAIELGSEILLPVYRTVAPIKTTSCHLFVSRDMGRSWIFRATIAMDFTQNISFHEPSLAVLENGDIMAFLRTGGADDRVYTCRSSNLGKSWSKFSALEPIIGHPTHPLKLEDGRILLTYGYRHKPYGIRARLLGSDGKTLIGKELIIRDDGLCADLGYPWAVQISTDTIVVVYYFTAKDGIRHIAASRITIK